MSVERTKECREAIRKFQLDFGPKISPRSSIMLNNRIEEAFEKDPTGSQVIHFLNDMREMLKPRVE